MPLGLAKDSMLNLAELANKHDDDMDGSSGKIEFDETDREKIMRVSTGEIQDQPGDSEEKKSGEDDPAEDLVDPSRSQPMPRLEQQDFEEDTGDSIIADDKVVGTTTSADNSITSDAATPAGDKVGSPASTAATSYGQYSGFSAQYKEYDYYDDPENYTAYAGTPVILNQKEQKGFLCCLFPWLQSPENDSDEEVGTETLVTVSGTEDGTKSQKTPSRSASKEEDDVSTGSDMFGEKLSDKDRLAVVARLRLGQPDLATAKTDDDNLPDESSTQNGKGLLNGIVSARNAAGAPKGILKRASVVSRQDLSQMSTSSGDHKGRRSLFPSYETKVKTSKNLNVDFSPMARVMTVKSQKDMDEQEKGSIWWQKNDYEEFRKTGRMITKAMLAGGSEIWLATNQSWQLPNQGRQATLKHACSLAERQAAFKKGDVKAKQDYEATRDKWWHKFGHSRRGLEHVASIDEGRQRQGNVRAALKAVIDEQRRQKVFHREDAEKLRMVSIQHTSWARDLARAAGASDEDAVSCQFDDDSRRSREFYLLKFSRANQANSSSVTKTNVPAFMKPALSVAAPNRLDANTVSQIRYRQKQQKAAVSVQQAQKSPSKAPEPPVASPESVPIKEVNESPRTTNSMAKKAAGFASGDQVANMSAVLTGMGPIPKKAVGVGGP